MKKSILLTAIMGAVLIVGCNSGGSGGYLKNQQTSEKIAPYNKSSDTIKKRSLQASNDTELVPVGKFNISGNQKGQSITPDGKYLFSLSADRHIDTYSINNDKSLNKLTYVKLDDTQNATAVSADGKVLYVATQNGYINSYSISQDGVLSALRQHKVVYNTDSFDFITKSIADTVNCVQTSITISPNGKFLVSTSDSPHSDLDKTELKGFCKKINVFKISDNYELSLSDAYQVDDYQYSATIGLNSNYLYTLSRDRNDYYIYTYQIIDGRLQMIKRDFFGTYPITNIKASPNNNKLYFSKIVPDGFPPSMRIFLTNSLAWVYIESDGKLNRYSHYAATQENIKSIVFSPDGNTLYTGHDNYIQWYNTTNL